MKIFEFVRQQFHPLHKLRKYQVFRETILPLLDRPYPAKVSWLVHPWWVRRLRHAALYLAAEDCEPRATALFSRLVDELPKESIVFDIGANVGKYTWLAASIREDLTIHSFEPDASNFALLQKTKLVCPNKNIQLHYMALSDHDGVAAFAVDQVTGATGTLESDENFNERHFHTKANTVEVKVSKLSTVVEDLGSPQLIKLDVEGHETAVFAGSGGLLQSSNPPIILFECFEHPLPFQLQLDEANYKLFDADDGGLAKNSTTNYWAVPQESQYLSFFQ